MKERIKNEILLTILVIVIILVFVAGALAYFNIQFKKEIAILENKLNTLKVEQEELNEERGGLENQLQDIKEGIEPEENFKNCILSLTEVEKDIIKDWKKISNPKHFFSLKYPSEWKVIAQEENSIEIRGPEDDVNFKIMAQASLPEIEEGFREKEIRTVSIFCQDAKQVSYTGDERAERIYVSFKRGKVSYVIILTYRDIDSLRSNNIVEFFNLILKTIEFK